MLACGEVPADRVEAVVALDGSVESGETVFDENCRGCHGPKGVGVLFAAPSLQGNTLTPREIVAQILGGGIQMPSFDGEISDVEIADVAAYVAQDVATR